MATFTQANRSLRLSTPLGSDALLITRLSGQEAISQLYAFQLDVLAPNDKPVDFSKLLGEAVGVELDLPGGKKRHFHGIVSRLSEGRRDNDFIRYRMEVVPKFWLFTRRTQCRIFQQKNVPEILKEVLKGLEVKFDLKAKYESRDFCVQYRETDFAFACRLMEEEGIFYYFAHAASGHTLVVADTPEAHANVPEIAKAIFDDIRGGTRGDLRVTDWEKVQELRSGKVTLWDHCFELPGQTLEAQNQVLESVAVGKVTHKLKVGGNDQLELYDYPGAFAQRFDGVDPGGGDRAADLEKIFNDNQRTAKIRMEQEAAAALETRGTSNCPQFTAGHKFTLERHFNGDGDYVLTLVAHEARLSANYLSGDGDNLEYTNTFTCIPAALPYRPPFRTPEPEIRGPQTATIVGAPGEKIFCDKYARVKVKFHWDRSDKKDADSSCWVRVSQNWGGAKWGGMFLPHVGQEVIVEFEEGDPDRPLVTGRVYNAETMPPLELPANKSQSIIRDHGGNEIKIEGEAGKEQIVMFSPHSNSYFTMGAKRNPPQGFSMFSNGFFSGNFGQSWDVLIGADETVSVDGRSKKTVEGYAETYVNGFYTQYVAGYVSNRTMGASTTFVGGIETAITIGAKNEMHVGYKTAAILAGKSEWDPVAKKNSAAAEKELIGKIDQKIGVERVHIGTLMANVKALTEDITKLNQKIGSLDQRIDRWAVAVMGEISETAASLEQKIKGSTLVDAGSYTLKSKGGIIINTKAGLFLEASGNTRMKFAGLQMNGSWIDMKSGALKVT